MANPLLDIINCGLDHYITKWNHYLPLYHRHFEKYKKMASPENKIYVLEIGVLGGGSIDLWNKYFGKDNCVIYGVDIDQRCRTLEKDNVKIIIGDQGDINFLKRLTTQIPQVDIVIDDGGHTMHQQITSFNILFDHLRPGGVYLCEDLHTSYWPNYGGGYKYPNTFIEFSKCHVDSLNGYHHGNIDKITKNCSGIHYYDSMVFYDKSDGPVDTPHSREWFPK